MRGKICRVSQDGLTDFLEITRVQLIYMRKIDGGHAENTME